ncbi:flagellar protein FlaG [Rummeliibacillus sp. JY-2-4R]
MRISSQIPPIEASNNGATTQKNAPVKTETNTKIMQKEEQNQFSKAIFQKTVDKLNEFMEVHNNNLKFIYHEGLKEYYVEVVNSKTEEVVREIPSKELLDAYYEMQKIIGNIVDEKI